MKKILIPSVILAFITMAVADIQAPPGKSHNSVHKLSRGLANLLYGWSEVPAQTIRAFDTSPSQAFSAGPIKGVSRTVARVGWGIYEVMTFPFPSVKGNYRVPYKNTIMKPKTGFEEFPPQIGFLSSSKYCRKTLY